MKRSREDNRIKLDWVQDAPFSVRLNRVAPRARRAPEPNTAFLLAADDDAWQAPSFLA